MNVHLPKRSSSLGIASLIVGIVGFLLCWIPFIGILTIPISGLGLLLGVIGLIVAFGRRGSGIGFPIAGSVVSGLALFVGVMQVAAIGAFADAIDQASREARRTNQTPVSPTDRSLDDYDSKTKSGPARRGSVKPQANGPRASEPEWASARGPVRQGDVQVRIVPAQQEHTPLKAAFEGATESKDEQFSIQVEIQNMSSSKKINYRTWQGAGFSIQRDYATLTDNFGNAYKRIDFGFGADVVGSVKSDSIYPGKSLSDLLVFEPPLATAEYLDLELPATNFDGDGMLRIRIPREMFRPKPVVASKFDVDDVERQKAELDAVAQESTQRAARKAEATRLAEEEARHAEEKARLAEEEAKFRTWTAKSSGKTIEAKIVSYASGKVTLEARNGKRSKVALDVLSDGDRDFVEKWREERR